MKRLTLTPWQLWFANFQRSFLVLLLPWLAAILIQFTGRAYLLSNFAPPASHLEFSADIKRTLQVGMLFDVKIASIVFSVFLAIALVFSAKAGMHKAWMKWLPWVAAGLTTAIAAITIVSIFYYFTFARAVDVFVFGLLDDDTSAVLGTLWKGYPVTQALAALVAVFAVVYLLSATWCRVALGMRLRPVGRIAAALWLVLIIGGTVLACRGSLGTFPLNKDDAQVSTLHVLNEITPNGISAFSWAFAQRRNNRDFKPVTEDEGKILFHQFLNSPASLPTTESGLTPSLMPGLAPFMDRTSPNPAVQANPPHVVLQLMESMGHHLNSFDRPDRDLLGALRPHWQEDWRFDRFLSEGNGTIDTLSRILVHSPIPTIGQSNLARTDFVSNLFKPYLQRGYKVVFVTSGAGTWRDINRLVGNLGATELVDQVDLQQRYPEAQANTWGVPDGFMFRYIEQRLIEADRNGEHVFILALSTTHHPPFTVPEGYGNQNYAMDDVAGLANFQNESLIKQIFETLHYTNDQLGKFLTRVKSAPVGRRTIIAVTGDHNILGMDYEDPHEAALAKAVPFYLYVPEAYKANATFDPARVGSQKDILPTLYNLSLSDTVFFRSGCNLVAPKTDATWCFGFNNPDLFITDKGAYVLPPVADKKNDDDNVITGPIALRKGTTFSPWQDSTGLLVDSPRPLSDAEREELTRLVAFPELLRWQINYQIDPPARNKSPGQ